ncbi:MAG: heme lyase CcmF/NrfE family subunit [Gammaproteobacteria bacterium]|nr:heme lyase CcmF/NrfE family subunit [Gammaproteobacteria bacterium]MBU1655700.1 heme lyase CcmF/NrfE family subunit [Gammaproteobacteria bacterium]MBU1961188.1 heme lyase CcmF/NrfE family subunit [Gammaproteobacteria bacterium]
MIPELGHLALLLAFCMAGVQALLPLMGVHLRRSAWIDVARPAVWSQFFFLGIAFIALAQSFVVNDFSVAYVAQNSNTNLPLLFRISAVWGAHEGSLLLWAFSLSLWTLAVSIFSRGMPDRVMANVIGVMGLISLGFLAFLIFTSNPFDRLWPAPAQGRDLNPLLQDFGLAIHPPMLYLGYVGFVVPFAFAIAAMLDGRLDAAWARWSRPWTNVAWMFLTLGIALGSWWAYYELGWGGWWFWDPVENASFMPWLVGTALMHSLAVTEKRGAFKAWTVLLAIFTFALSLLGTFLVRSGVLTSVHAFASDPGRGVFVLIFLCLVVGGSLTLYALRAEDIRSRVGFSPLSRETGLLLNNLLLTALTAAILLGTLYPLLLDALNLGKISVGPPYFNSVFVPLAIPLALAVGVGALARWKRDEVAVLWRKLRVAAMISLILGPLLVVLVAPAFSWQAVLGLVLAVWVVASTCVGLRERIANKPSLAAGLKGLPRAYWGMVLGHTGIALFVVGVSLTSLYSTEKDVRLEPGQSYELAGYSFEFVGVEDHAGPNFTASRGEFRVTRDGQRVAHLFPEKRVYRAQGMPMTEAGIDPGLTRDLFVALGEPLGGKAWAVRLYHKPFIRWIWLGGLVMALGGLVAATDRRYRSLKRRSAATNNGMAAGAA